MNRTPEQEIEFLKEQQRDILKNLNDIMNLYREEQEARKNDKISFDVELKKAYVQSDSLTEQIKTLLSILTPDQVKIYNETQKEDYKAPQTDNKPTYENFM